MNRIIARIFGFLLVFVAAASTARADTVYITADSTSQSKGYTSFELTTFRPGRHLIDTVRTGNDRSRRIITTLTSTAAWFEIVTATDSADVLLEYITPTHAIVEVNGEFAIEYMENEFGDLVVTDFEVVTPGTWKSLQTLGIFFADVNVRSAFVELAPYDDLINEIVLLQTGPACHAANCAGPGITNEDECQDCCDQNCNDSNAQLIGCFNTCGEVWNPNPAGVPFVVLGFLAASGAVGCVLRRRDRRGINTASRVA